MNKLVGQGLDRYDGRLKVTGRARYSADMPIPNLAHAVIVQSTIAKGQIKSIDISKAEALPGVLAVVTYLNAMKTSGAPLLNGPEITFSGEHIGVVVAETLEQATEGARLVHVEYEVDKPVTVLEDHLADSVPGQSRGPGKRGNFDTGIAAATKKINQVYRTPIEHHNPLEPHAATAVWEGEKLTVYDATQGISGSQQNLATTFGLPPASVRVIAYFIGGGFGCKGMPWPHTPIAALAAKTVKRPVKLVLKREQMFTSNGHRPQTRQEMTLGTDNEGKLTALKHTSHTSTALKASFTEPTGSVSSMMYSCPNLTVEQRLVRLTTGGPTYMRAPGESSGSFATEVAMDEMAAEVGMDPIAFRLKNYSEMDESSGHPWSSKSLKECYAKAAEQFGWSRRNPTPRSMREGNTLIGMGMASATYPANYRPASAKARLNPDGGIWIACGTQDLGTGSYTILQQIAADALAVPLDRVRVDIGDTLFPAAPGSGGSTSASSAGSAVNAAALALKAKLVNLASTQPESPVQGVAEAELEAKDGRIGKGGKSISYADLVKRAGVPNIEVEAKGEGRSDQYSMHSFGAQFAEVHVDADLGTVRVARFVSAFAAGKILNTKTGLSQFQGGIIFGIGMALLEESVLDPVYSRYANGTFAEYHVPVNADVPNIEVIMVPEEDSHVNPIGVKGIGEIGIVGAAAAICNAVYHATGKRIRDLPITLDKLI